MALIAGFSLLATACAGDPDADPLDRIGLRATEGAAAGYVDDQSCARCHADIARSYREVGMAQSLYRPSRERIIEDFDDGTYHHQPSGRHYRMWWEGDRLLFGRHQLDAQGQPIHQWEVEVDWVLGSGHTSRTYLFRNPDGELYQLPLAWYTQGAGWAMSPGYDNPDHLGLRRRVSRECMFCHNAYPEVAAGSDAYGQPQVFPAELPEGIGCQRCHGPGAEHVRAALRGEDQATLDTITNPADLDPTLAAQICNGCHLQPTVALQGVRRFGRPIYSFRPGEALTDYMAPLDVDVDGETREERFEINHHPYRLQQSLCFQESPAGTLGCTTCHDPHRKVAPERRKAHYRDACFSCHQLDDCDLESMSAAAREEMGLESIAADDCAACHMPRRRTQDVIHVAMTDHKIQRHPGGPELLAPLEETTPILVAAEMLETVSDIPPDLAEIYKASAVVRAGSNLDAAAFLSNALPGLDLEHPEPYVDLGQALLGESRFADAEQVLSVVLARWPEMTRARDWRAIALFGLGRGEEALADLEEVLRAETHRSETYYNQGLVLLSLGRDGEAEQALRRAVELRPNLPRAWTYLGRVLAKDGRLEAAEEALRRALAVDPADADPAIALARLLDHLGRRDEAVDLLEHSARWSRNPEEIEPVLGTYRQGP